jgi:NADPH-dependent 2,4-dienoyl-CoA reductase/sulfur reductase-like enzyme
LEHKVANNSSTILAIISIGYIIFMVHYDVLIVGAGLTGATIAEHYKRAGKKVLVIDKREHLGGNCYDEVDAETGIRVSKYGAHLFHTNDEEVWDCQPVWCLGQVGSQSGC